MKTAIEVYIRTKPTDSFAHENVKIDNEKSTILIHIPKKEEDGPVNHQQDQWSFKFDKVIQNESQEGVFELVGKKAVSSLIDGVSCSVITYGQTGAGKTFTAFGFNNDYKFRGLVPRAISEVFRQISEQPERIFRVRVSFVEIYNEVLHDLLQKDLNSSIVLQEDPLYGVIPKGAYLAEVSTEEETLSFMFEGQANRTIAEHKLNK